MIEQLVAILEQKFKDLTAEETADILWLTLQQWQTDAAALSQTQSSSSSSKSSSVEIIDSDAAPVLPLTNNVSASVPAPRPLPMAGLTTRTQTEAQSKTPSTLDAPLAIPDAPALRNTLDLLKALRPLMRQEPSAQGSYLDVPATVRAIAETDLWSLQLRPVLEPWLELAIVVDATASMVIWQRTILSLRRVLAQSGVFRDVRMWSLETQDLSERSPQQSSPNAKLCIRSGFGPAASLQPPCRPQELIDPNGRRLILVISDCIAPHWDTQQIRDLLQIWAKYGPMALVQVLPEWLWNRTALNDVVKGQIYSLTPGQSNQSLTFIRRERWRRTTLLGVKVPVLTLEPDVANRWSQMVAGKATVSAPGLLFSSVSSQQSSFDLEPGSQKSSSAQPVLTSEQRLEQFRNFSSAMARRLAGLLASCPEVNLPIVRMVQAAMLPDAQQVHVAEVLLGGLFKPQIEITAHTPADQVQYVFHDGVQPLVQDTIPSDRVFAALSTWLNYRFGYALEDFRAHIILEQTEQIKPFAGVMLDILKRRGDEYAEIISSIEPIYQPQYTTFTALSQAETASQDYEINAHVRSSGIAVIAIHGGNLQPGTTQIAKAVAGNIHSFYSFVSLKPEIDQTLYIPSTQFDEATALDIVGRAQTVLSIHGCQGETEFIKVGGLDRDGLERIKTELAAAGFSVSDDETGGTNPDNLCNRGRNRRGVQLEISRRLRRRLINSANEVQDSAGFSQLVEVLQRCLQVTTTATAFTRTESRSEANFPDLETLEFTIAQLIDAASTAPFPPLQTQDVEVVTIVFEAKSEELQPFEFESATIERRVEWVIRRQRRQAQRWVEALGNNLQLEMVAIPSGSFLMGSPNGEPDSAVPQHQVRLAAFFMGRYPVTQAQWQFVTRLPQVKRELQPDPSYFKGGNCPVERVSWDDAMEFCARLSAHTGRDYRLPTEAEWEYACRAGTTTPFHVGETITPDLANYDGTSMYNDGPKGGNRGKTTPVDHFGLANTFGLCDMHGNVFEWCEDHWHSNYEGAPVDGSAWISENDTANRVVRGGSWYNNPRYSCSAYRNDHAQADVNFFIGFRVVCSAPRTLK